VELALQTDPAFALARTADLSLPEREALTDYLLTRLAIPALSMGQLDNTYESQLEAAKKEVQENRTMLLIAMGLVGLGLISWAFTVVFRQLKRDQRNLDAVTRDEDEEPRQSGSERRLLWSLLGVVIPAILNVVGIIFLMSLIFR